MRAARGGFKDIVDGFLNKLPEPERLYFIVALGAASGAHQALAEHFVNQLPEEKRNFNMVAAAAASENEKALADYFLNKLPEHKRHYNLVASWAAQGGCQGLAEHYLNQLPLEQRNYSMVATAAYEADYPGVADHFNQLDRKGKATLQTFFPLHAPAAKTRLRVTDINSTTRDLPSSVASKSFMPGFNVSLRTQMLNKPTITSAIVASDSTSTERPEKKRRV